MDYGAILLCDQRFGSPDIIQQLSAWVRPRVQNFPKIGPLLRDLGIFFRNNEIVFPGSAKAVRAPVPVDSNRDDYKKHSTVDSFHHALSSSSSRVTAQNYPKANRPLQESYQVDLSGYSSTSRPTIAKETTIFDDSQVTTKVIDFNETESPALSRDNNYVKSEVGQPAVKKRKLTIVSDAEKAKYDRRRMKEATDLASAPETSGSSTSSLNQPTQVNIVNPKKENAAEYLKAVKSQLQPVHYTTFSDMIRSYRSDKNFDCLLSTLKKLFLQDPKLRHLFKG